MMYSLSTSLSIIAEAFAAALTEGVLPQMAAEDGAIWVEAFGAMAEAAKRLEAASRERDELLAVARDLDLIAHTKSGAPHIDEDAAQADIAERTAATVIPWPMIPRPTAYRRDDGGDAA